MTIYIMLFAMLILQMLGRS